MAAKKKEKESGDNRIAGETPFRENQRLAARIKELERLSQIKSEFISILSHEVRTPLTLIKGYLQVFMKDASLTSKQIEKLNVIRDNTDALIAMFEDLLDLSRLETGRIQLNLGELDVVEIVKDMSERYRRRAAESGLSLSLSVPPLAPRIFADREKILQVIINLVDNALKFTPAGGRVTLGVEAETRGVWLFVRDTGCGIAPEDLERVFDKFYQAHQVSQGTRKGLGLGLSIARGIVEAHGGEIGAQSDPGRGSEFRFFLPVYESTEPLGIHLERELLVSRKNASPLSIVLVAVEGLESLDPDRLDRFLEMAARLLHTILRSQDMVIKDLARKRLAIISATNPGIARSIATRTRAVLSGKNLLPDLDIPRPLNLKIGFASFPDEGGGKADILALAEKRLEAPTSAL